MPQKRTAAGASPKTEPPGDFSKLQGTWSITSLEMNGQKLPLAGATITIKGDRFITSAMGAKYEGMMSVDESANPKTFDMKFTAGPEKGNTSLGIYELDGDNWKICLGVTAKSRPKTFAAPAGSGFALETLARGASAAAAKSADAPAVDISEMHIEPAPELDGEWQMISCNSSGESLPAKFIKGSKRRAKNNEVSVFVASELFLRAKCVTVDRSKKPMTIDYVHTKGATAGQMQYGIYELDGDTLKTCFAVPGQPRPTDFVTKPGDLAIVTVWKKK